MEHTIPYTPQQNRVADQKNISLKEMASYMVHARSLASKLWVGELNCSNYMQNRSPHRYVKDINPLEAWRGCKLKVTHFQIFGSHAWALIPSEKRKALDLQRIAYIFMGYHDDVKGYRSIDSST